MGKGVWGIDVSRYSLKAVRLEQTKDGLVLTDVEVIRYPIVGKVEEVELEGHVREALKQLKYSRRIGSERVVLSLPTHSAFNRLVKLPPLGDLEMAIGHEARQQIPFLEQNIWGYQIVERQYQTGEEKDIILIAVKQESVEAYLKIADELGLNVDQIQLSPVAVYNFLSFDQDMSVPTIVLEIGADTGTLIVIENDRFWARNLPRAGNDITKAIHEGLNVPMDKAEKIKLEGVNSPHVEKVYETILPIYKDIVSEIHRSLGYYKTISKQAKFDRLLLLGNGTKTLNFHRFMGQSLSSQPLKLQKLNKIALGPAIDTETLNHHMQTVPTALGLALQGWGLAKNRVNLLPESYRKRKQAKKKYPIVVLGLAMMYAALILAYVQNDKRIKDMQSSIAAVKVVDVADTKIKDLLGVRNVAPITAELELFRGIGADRSSVTRLLEAILKNFPDNSARNVSDRERVWLMSIDLDHWDGDKQTRNVGGGGGGAGVPVQPKRTLSFKMVVAIAHYLVDRVGAAVPEGAARRNEAEGREFVLKQLKLDQVEFNGKKILPLVTISPDGFQENLKPDPNSAGPADKFRKYIVKFDLDIPAEGR